MAVFPPHGLVGWDDELYDWLQVSHFPDGTLRAGSSPTPRGYDYLFTTDGTTISVYDNSGTLLTTGTDVGALVTARAANYKSMLFGSGVFPWTTVMDLDLFIGLSLTGQGGQQDERKAALGGRGATQFKWTPAAGMAFTASGTQGLHLNGIAFQWSNAAYTVGDGTEDAVPFMTIEGVDHDTPTRHTVVENCYMGAVSGGKLDTGGPILDINKTVNIAFRSCLFSGGTMNVRGHHTVTADDFANVVEFTACRFSRHKAPNSANAGWASIRSSGESWAFRNCHWEPSASGPLYLFDVQVENFRGLTFTDCWAGDQFGTPAADASLIAFHGYGLVITGGRYNLKDGYSLVRVNNSVCEGVNISGTNVAMPNDAVNGFIDNSANHGVKGLVLDAMTIWPTTVPLFNGTAPEPPRTGQIPYFSKTAAYTLVNTDHLRVCGVDATAGAVTITLPPASCVGCTVTVKKTDASANAVTVTRAGSNTIEGATTYALATQYKFVRLVATGTVWMIVGSN